MNPQIRNTKVSAILNSLFDQVDRNEYTRNPIFDENIEALFNTNAWGFREIILVICVARLLNEDFQASQDFYACNPRPLYEQPIRSELDKRGIPSRQSGPLNVAKGAKKIDQQWAAGREPRTVADKVVSLVQSIEGMSRDELENFTKQLLVRFLEEATVVEQLNVQSEPNADPLTLQEICRFLIDNAPDGGNTPQRIIGYLLESYHEELQTGLIVSGHTDRASTTSTTSKKIGDVTEEQLDGLIASIYEVTVKNFGSQRVREAYEAAKSHSVRENLEVQEIVVLCRRQDVHPDVAFRDSIYFGKLDYQDITFHFVDIYEWIMAQLLRLTVDARLAFFEALQEYVFDKNTSSTVKNAWAEITEV